LAEGEVRGNVTIRLLKDVTRGRGVVRGAAGEAVPKVLVWCGGGLVTTDGNGQFDLGHVRLANPRASHIAVRFQAPRPRRVAIAPPGKGNGSRVTAKVSRPTGQFFHHRRVLAEVSPDRQVDLDVVLQPTELLTFTGRVLDHTGAAAARTNVVLFAGNAGQETWTQALYPPGASGIPSWYSRPDVALGNGVADENGCWAIHVAKETKEGLKIANVMAPRDASSYSIGAMGPRGGSALLRDVVLKEGQIQKQGDIRLGPSLRWSAP